MCSPEQLERKKFPWFVNEMNCMETREYSNGKILVTALHRPGVSESEVLIDLPATTVCRCRMSSGVSLERHWHRQTEIVTVCKGVLVMEVAGEASTLRCGDSIVVEAGCPHSAFVHVDAEFTVVFHPSLKLCPEGECADCEGRRKV